ncbi:MAG: hypothetical protein DMG37_10870, partial [Acidobacteria bacterium]
MPEHHAAAAHSKPIAPRDPSFYSQVNAVVNGRHSDPFAFLGPHPVDGGCAVRFFLPWAEEARIYLQQPTSDNVSVPAPKIVEASKLRYEGFFEAILPPGETNAPAPSAYKIRCRNYYGESFDTYDP